MRLRQSFSALILEVHLRAIWPELYPRIKRFSKLAKLLDSQGRGEESTNANMCRHSLQVHAVIACYVTLRIARDRKRRLLVGSRQYSVHHWRICDIIDLEPEWNLAKVPIAILIDQLISNSSPSRTDFDVAFSKIRVLPLDTRKTLKALQEAMSYWEHNRLPAARHNCQVALSALRRAIMSASNVARVAARTKEVKRLLSEFRKACDTGFVPLPVCKSLFIAIENLSWMTTKHIFQPLKDVQLAAKLARLHGRFEEAKRLLKKIESDLFDPPPSAGTGSSFPSPLSPLGLPFPSNPLGGVARTKFNFVPSGLARGLIKPCLIS